MTTHSQPSLVTLKETGAFVAVSGEACGSRAPSEACDREEVEEAEEEERKDRRERMAPSEDMVAVGKLDS